MIATTLSFKNVFPSPVNHLRRHRLPRRHRFLPPMNRALPARFVVDVADLQFVLNGMHENPKRCRLSPTRTMRNVCSFADRTDWTPRSECA